MAEVYKEARGMYMEELIAHHSDVQYELDVQITGMLHKAEAIKAWWVDQHDSKVSADKGEIDRWLYLDDTRGLKAAMAMEYGANEHDNFPETPAQAILHQATGLPMKPHHPRKRRGKSYYKVKSKRRRRGRA